jgi:uncharacterized protein YkwD
VLRKIIFYIYIIAAVLITGCTKNTETSVNSADSLSVDKNSEKTSTGLKKQSSDETPADYYGFKKALKFNAEEQDIWTAISEHFSNVCKLDGALMKAARRHAGELQNNKIAQGAGLDYLRSALRFYGSFDYSVFPIVFNPSPDGISEFLQLLSEEAKGITHCGIGVYKGSDKNGSDIFKAVWIGVERSLKMNPIPVKTAVGKNITVRGEFNSQEHFDIEAYLQVPDGAVHQIKTYVLGRRSFSLTVPVTETGKYILELQVTGINGPETSVLVPLFADIPVEIDPVVFPDTAGSGLSLADEIFQLVNAVRNNMGLKSLKRDSRLDKIAAAHSLDMVSSGYFGHFSTTSGMLEDRLDASHLFPAQMAENVAKSSSVFRVHHNLMGSPSHRIKILDPAYTHMGAGVVQNKDSVVVTEIFVSW